MNKTNHNSKLLLAYKKEVSELKQVIRIYEKELETIYNSKEWQLISLFRKKIMRMLPYQINTFSVKKRYPLVSVVIPCFNYGRYIEEAIESVEEQTYPLIEIIVVNDGSTDLYTLEVLSHLKKHIKVLNQKNKGLPTARNEGVNIANGKYICCLDADDKIAPTYIYKCVVKMEAQNLSICGSYQKNFGDEYLNLKTPSLNVTLDVLKNTNSFVVASLFTKSIWKKVGGYDSKMTNGYEDWDFWISILEKEVSGGNIPEYLFMYRKHGHSMIRDSEKIHSQLYKYIKLKHRNLFIK